MKKIIFTLALICATACSSNKTVETDSVVEDSVEVVDSVSIDTVITDSVI